MFTRSAEFYDVIYRARKDYPAESERIARLVRAAVPHARTLLDVACGTGEHARCLHDEHGFAVDGLDADPALLVLARRKIPDAHWYEADMCDFHLPARYDAVLCLFSSIGYVRTPERLRSTLACFRAHLAAGGVAIVEPWFAPDAFHPGSEYVVTAALGGSRVTRRSRSVVEGRVSRLFFEYVIEGPAGLDRREEVHELGLFTTAEMLAAFADAGLAARFDPAGLTDRGLYTAVAA